MLAANAACTELVCASADAITAVLWLAVSPLVAPALVPLVGFVVGAGTGVTEPAGSTTSASTKAAARLWAAMS